MGRYGAKKEEKPPVKILTNQEKAQEFTKGQVEQIATQIEEGKMQVNPQKKRIKSPPKIPQNTEEQTLESIEESLKLMRANIKDQKMEQKQIEKAKLIKAHELITKLKREKDEHKQKLQENEEKSVLQSRIFSESTIGKMREKLQERINQKRKEIQERVKSIAERQGHREKKGAGQQIQYWEKVKKLNPHSQSSKELPSLLNPETVERKKSVAHLQRKNSMENLPIEQPYGKKIDIYLQKAKIRHRNIDMKLVEQKNEERLNKLINSNKKLASKLGEGNQFIPYNIQKSKLFGDEYLKESLLKVKKNTENNMTECNSDSLQESMELKAHEKYINPNQNVEKLKQNYDRMLSRIRHNEISQEQGLEVLNSMERRLDKIDLQGMRDRLKRKFQMLQQKQSESKQESRAEEKVDCK